MKLHQAPLCSRTATRIGIALAATLLLEATVRGGDLPAALQHFESERMRAETGVVEWSRTDAGGAIGEDADRVRFYTSRFAGDTTARTASGDENGVVVRLPDGTPAPQGSAPQHGLSTDGQVWIRQSGTINAQVYGAGGRAASPPDLRTLGASARPVFPSIYGETWKPCGDLSTAQFQESTDGDLRVVRAAFPSGKVVQWWFDPAKAFSIVRVKEFDPTGTPRFECRSSLAKYDEVWLPSKVEYFDSNFTAAPSRPALCAFTARA